MVQGETARGFDAVRDAFQANLDSGLERGGAVAAWLDGRPEVDLWGGTRDLAERLPWQRDTLVNVWSVGNGVVALAAMKPNWAPGSVCVCHPETYGYLAGELVRRADGRSTGCFVAQEIVEPLALSFHFGLPEAQDHRAAQIAAESGQGDARSRAKLHGALAMGGTLDGHRLVSRHMLARTAAGGRADAPQRPGPMRGRNARGLCARLKMHIIGIN